MQDFKFDIENNDIVFDTDMVIIDSCSVQNGTLIFMKSVASIDNPSIGVGFQEVAINVNQNEATELATRAENQILNDGGRIAEISVQETEESGVYEYELQVVYNSEYCLEVYPYKNPKNNLFFLQNLLTNAHLMCII